MGLWIASLKPSVPGTQPYEETESQKLGSTEPGPARRIVFADSMQPRANQAPEVMLKPQVVVLQEQELVTAMPRERVSLQRVLEVGPWQVKPPELS